MESINTICLSGNLAADSELRETRTGFQILAFRLATTRNKKENSGEWGEYPIFLDCKLYGSRAESLSTMLHKGAHVVITGKLGEEKWKDKQTGAERSKLVVECNNVEVAPRSKPAQQQEAPSVYADEDIPF